MNNKRHLIIYIYIYDLVVVLCHTANKMHLSSPTQRTLVLYRLMSESVEISDSFESTVQLVSAYCMHILYGQAIIGRR